MGVLEEGLEADSGTLQQLIAYEHYLEGLLSLLALCRKYDTRERSGPKVMRKNGQDDENNKTRITHCQLENKLLDPYEILKSKSQRLSLNQLSDAEIHLDKRAVISWFERLRNYSEEMVKAHYC
ncbi:hypothetical protein ACT691_20685 [Vibrio metschnikovii]